MRMSALLVTRMIRKFKAVFVMLSDFSLHKAVYSSAYAMLHLILINSVEFVAFHPLPREDFPLND